MTKPHTHLQESAGQDSAVGNKGVTGTAVPIHCAHDETWPLDKFREHPRNPNKHPAEQLRLLGKVIAGNGWRSPICVSTRSGLVIKGHGRLHAARLAGMTEAPVDLQDYASEADELADLVADNRIAELAEISAGELAGLVRELQASGIDTELVGFDGLELGRLLQNVRADGENSAGEVWQGMPDCEANNLLGIFIKVRFKTVDEKIAFSKQLEQTVTADTNSIWFPKWVQDQLGTKEGIAYVES